MITNILQTLSILILLLFPFGELLRFDLGNNIAFKPLDFVVGITALVWVFSMFIKRKKINYKRQLLFFPIAALFSLGINSTWLKPTELMVSSFYLIRWVSYALLIPVFWSFTATFKKKITYLLFVDGLVITLLGYLQYFFYPNLRNLFYLGWDDHLYRMFSVFFDPNFAGAFFVLFLVFIGGILYDYQNIHHSGPRQTRLMQSRMKILSLYIILFLVLGAVFLTFSRSALLMLAASAIVFLTLIKRKKLLFVLFGIMVGVILIISPWFYLENVNLFRVNSSMARVDSSLHALQIFNGNPLFGVGFNTYRYAQIKYGIIKPNSPFPSHAASGVENSYFFVLATTGIVGFIGFLAFWYYWLKQGLGIYRKNAAITAVMVISSLAGLFVDTLFINSIFFPELMLWVFVLLGLMERT